MGEIYRDQRSLLNEADWSAVDDQTQGLAPSERSDIKTDSHPGYVVASRTAVRRPPELRLLHQSVTGPPMFDQVFIAQIEKVQANDTGALAFSVAELANRREHMILSSGNQGAIDGLNVVSEMAKMYEHLFILQSWHGGD